MPNFEMLKDLDWSGDCYESSFSDPVEGYSLGYANFYGGDNTWYPAIRRESDGAIAYTPTDKDNPFTSEEWRSKFLAKPERMTRAEAAAIASAARRIPEDRSSCQVQINLPKCIMAAFQDLTPLQRGAIVELGMRIKTKKEESNHG
jgi:hypothetical protein